MMNPAVLMKVRLDQQSVIGVFNAGKCSRATQKSFTGCKWRLSGTLSTPDLQRHVSARPSKHVISWKSWPRSLSLMAAIQNFSSVYVCILIRNIPLKVLIQKDAGGFSLNQNAGQRDCL